jgi:peptidoglycan/LPS O-acetylase OafA/YrhL
MWRGVACLSVLVFHVTGFRWNGPDLLWIGVPLFFVISGYCIASTADRHHAGQRPWREFVQRRLLRIFPPYFAALLFSASLYLLTVPFVGDVWTNTRGALEPIPHPATLTMRQWFGTVTLTEGWRPILTGYQDASRWFQGHAWSLGYEEQFYLVTGGLFLLAGARWPIAAGLLTLLSIVTAAITGPLLRGLFLDGRWLLFACGLAVYLHLSRRLPAWVAPLLLAGAVMWSASRSWFLASHVQHFALELFIAAGFAVVLIALRPFDPAVGRLFGASLLRWYGIRCYSMYLLHWPIAKIVGGFLLTEDRERPAVALLSIALTLAATTLLTIPFHRWIERPCCTATSGRTDPLPHWLLSRDGSVAVAWMSPHKFMRS